jgi:hypothetical protein
MLFNFEFRLTKSKRASEILVIDFDLTIIIFGMNES